MYGGAVWSRLRQVCATVVSSLGLLLIDRGYSLSQTWFESLLYVALGLCALLWPELRRSYSGSDDVRRAWTSLCSRLTLSWLVLVAVYVHDEGAGDLYAELNPVICSSRSRSLPVSVLVGLPTAVACLLTAINLVAHLFAHRTVRGVDWSTVHDNSILPAVHVLLVMAYVGVCYSALVLALLNFCQFGAAVILLPACLHRLLAFSRSSKWTDCLAVVLSLVLSIISFLLTLSWRGQVEPYILASLIAVNQIITFGMSVELAVAYQWYKNIDWQEIGVIEMESRNLHAMCRAMVMYTAMVIAGCLHRDVVGGYACALLAILANIFLAYKYYRPIVADRQQPEVYIACVTRSLGLGRQQLVDDVCLICCLPMTKTSARVTCRCSHVFHSACLLEWTKAVYDNSKSSGCPSCEATTCPTCRCRLSSRRPEAYLLL